MLLYCKYYTPTDIPWNWIAASHRATSAAHERNESHNGTTDSKVTLFVLFGYKFLRRVKALCQRLSKPSKYFPASTKPLNEERESSKTKTKNILPYSHK